MMMDFNFNSDNPSHNHNHNDTTYEKEITIDWQKFKINLEPCNLKPETVTKIDEFHSKASKALTFINSGPTWLTLISEQLNILESQINISNNMNNNCQFPIQLIRSKPRVNPGGGRGDYLSLNLTCRDCMAKYSFKTKQRPHEDQPTFQMIVTKKDKHNFAKHQLKNSAVRPERGERGRFTTQSQSQPERKRAKTLEDELVAFSKEKSQTIAETQTPTPTLQRMTNPIQYNKQQDHQNGTNNNNNSNSNSSDWLFQLINVQESMQAALPGKFFEGYVQDIQLRPHFSTTLQQQRQVTLLKTIPLENRVICLHTIPEKHLHQEEASLFVLHPQKWTGQFGNRDRGVLTTYVFTARDSRCMKEQKPLLFLSETTTTTTTTTTATTITNETSKVLPIGQMLLSLRHRIDSTEPKEPKICKLFLLDCCLFEWPTINAICEQLNHETFEKYNHRVFQLASGNLSSFDDDDDSKSLLGFCASQTMSRFVSDLEKLLKFNSKKSSFHHEVEIYRELELFATECFSLMMSSRDVSQLTSLFEHIVWAFLSPTSVQRCLSSVKTLREEIFNKKKEVSNNHLYMTPKELKKEELEEKDEEEEEEEEKKLLTDDLNFSTSSPFNLHFKQVLQLIKQEIQQEQEQEQQQQLQFNENEKPAAEEANEFFFPAYIDFLMQHFMPFACMWANFTFDGQSRNNNDSDYEVEKTQWSNLRRSIIRNTAGFHHSGTMKLQPHEYVMKAFRNTAVHLDDWCNSNSNSNSFTSSSSNQSQNEENETEREDEKMPQSSSSCGNGRKTKRKSDTISRIETSTEITTTPTPAPTPTTTTTLLEDNNNFHDNFSDQSVGDHHHHKLDQSSDQQFFGQSSFDHHHLPSY